jgi:hypothetical protein
MFSRVNAMAGSNVIVDEPINGGNQQRNAEQNAERYCNQDRVLLRELLNSYDQRSSSRRRAWRRDRETSNVSRYILGRRDSCA